MRVGTLNPRIASYDIPWHKQMDPINKFRPPGNIGGRGLLLGGMDSSLITSFGLLSLGWPSFARRVKAVGISLGGSPTNLLRWEHVLTNLRQNSHAEDSELRARLGKSIRFQQIPASRFLTRHSAAHFAADHVVHIHSLVCTVLQSPERKSESATLASTSRALRWNAFLAPLKSL